MRNDEYLNNLKKLDQERREAILRNHKNSKSPISKPKVAKKNTTKVRSSTLFYDNFYLIFRN